MRLGGALGGVDLQPEHLTYQDIKSSFRWNDRLEHYNSALNKYRDIESGKHGADEVLDTIFDIKIALTLSADGFLPNRIQQMLSRKTLGLVDEAQVKKLTLNSFHITAPQVGRKRDHMRYYSMINSVCEKLRNGDRQLAAYGLVAKEFNMSPHTVRREFERFKIKLKSLEQK
jgi:hypothetical protein